MIDSPDSGEQAKDLRKMGKFQIAASNDFICHAIQFFKANEFT
jgi:hypothetical protein